MSLNKLLGVAAAGLVACVGMYSLLSNKVSSQIINSSICQKVLQEVEKHQGTLQFLGAPLEISKAHFANAGIYFTGQSDVKMIVKGPKSGGIIFFSMVESDGEPKNLKVNSIQLQVGMDDTKRLVIKKPDDSEITNNSISKRTVDKVLKYI